MSAADVVTGYFAPALGTVLAMFMFASPLPEIRRCREKGTIGSLNPLPYPIVAANCVSWMMYGAISGNYWVYCPNFTGLFAGAYYGATAYALSAESRPTMERLTGGLIFLVSLVGMILSCVMHNSSDSSRLVVAGVQANTILAVYYMAPMSTMAEVIRTKDSKSMHFPLVVTNCLNGLCWFAFGIGLNDWWLAAPNLFGSCVSIVQLGLIAMYPNSERRRGRMVTASSTEGLVPMSNSGSSGSSSPV